MRFFHNTNIDFVGQRGKFFTLSLIVIAVGLVSSFFLPPELGIDFTGGSEIGVKFSKEIKVEDLRHSIENTELSGAEIKSWGGDNSYLIRVKVKGDAEAIVESTLMSDFAEANPQILKADKIGPKIGGEMRTDALIAIFLSVISILLYVAFRFEFVYGVGAIIALVHDLIITFLGIVIINHLGLINLELTQAVLAGMLTVLGTSINDTVIIFDRIRENKEKPKGRSFSEIVNVSINENLSRTVNTTLTTSMVLLTIVIFGGPVLEGFAFTMLLGFIVGTYSSIYIASSMVIWYTDRNKGSESPVKSKVKLAR